jgi:Predicted GTPase
MEQYKLIFSGPVGVGKTTAVAALCDGKLLTTEAMASDMTKLRKETTTVAFDYGVVDLEDGGRLHVYGTPGQERFDFMWDILSEGGLGLVLMLDNSRSAPLNDLRFFINSFREFISTTALVLGITRTDEHPQPNLSTYRKELETLGITNCPVFEVDARIRENVLTMVQALLYQLDPELVE